VSFFNDLLSTLPVVGSFVSSDSENQMGDEYKKNQALWQKLLDNYQGPESDPRYAEMMSGMADAAKTGLTPADRAAMLEEYSNAGQFARGREGAIEQNQQMRGGGVANSGQSAVLQQQAAQAAAQRAQGAGMQQAGIAGNRAMQARMGYLNTLANNAEAMNRYKLAAAGGATGANSQMGNMYGAQDASRKAGMQHWIDTAVNTFGGKAAPGGAGAGYTSQVKPYGEDSYLTDGGGYGFYGT
jgi:hypothetical protein